MVFEIMDRSGRALAAIEGVVRGLAPVPGRKVVVLVSDGFLVGLGAAENRAFDVRRITDAATQRGRRRSTPSTRAGSWPTCPAAARRSRAPASSPPRERGRTCRRAATRRSSRASTRSPRTPAASSCGTPTTSPRLRPDPARQRGLLPARLRAHERRARRQVPEDRGAACRAGRDLSVRTRSGYFAPDDRKAAGAADETPEARREREIGQALGSLFPLDGVPMRMSADFIDLPPAGPQAVVRTRLDVSGVPFVPTGERYDADLEIAVAVYDETGDLVGERGRRPGPAQPHRGELSPGARRRAHRAEDGRRSRPAATRCGSPRARRRARSSAARTRGSRSRTWPRGR